MIKLYEFNPIEMLRDSKYNRIRVAIFQYINSSIRQIVRISSCKIMNILKVKYGSSTLIGGNSSLECNEMAE